MAENVTSVKAFTVEDKFITWKACTVEVHDVDWSRLLWILTSMANNPEYLQLWPSLKLNEQYTHPAHTRIHTDRRTQTHNEHFHKPISFCWRETPNNELHCIERLCHRKHLVKKIENPIYFFFHWWLWSKFRGIKAVMERKNNWPCNPQQF